MSKNGIEHKDVPEHRLINARKIAVNSSVHDYRKAEKPQLPKQDTMWEKIKAFSLKRLFPFIKKVGKIKLDFKIVDGFVYYDAYAELLGERILESKGSRKL